MAHIAAEHPRRLLSIKQNPQDEVPTEVMATAIRDIAEGTRKMLGGRLNKRAVLVLLKDATRESLETIDRVLSAASNLDKSYLKLALLAAIVGLGTACAPKVLKCNQEPTYWGTDGQGRVSTQIHVCFRDDKSLAYEVRPFTPPPPQPQAPPAPDPLKALDAKIEAELEAIRRTAATFTPKASGPRAVLSDDQIAKKRAAADKLKLGE